MTRRGFVHTLTGLSLTHQARVRAKDPAKESASAAPLWSRGEPHMGCLWTLTLPGIPEGLADQASAAVFAEIHRLNAIFSDYEATSELNQLCAKSGQAEAVPVSVELFDILHRSREISEINGGLFDVTLAPCTRLWRRSRRRGELPDAEALTKARELSGWRHMELDATRRAVRLAKPGMQLDLGGIAKGWTQDACLKLLKERYQITSVLLDAAGEVAAGSPPPGRDAWHIGLLPSGGKPAGRIPLTHANVATSGDHYQFVDIAGIRYSHIIDPRTGLGSTISRQVSLIAPTGSLADPLTKLLCLMDPAESLPLLEKNWPGLHARITTRLPDQILKVDRTADFPPFLEE